MIENWDEFVIECAKRRREELVAEAVGIERVVEMFPYVFTASDREAVVTKANKLRAEMRRIEAWLSANDHTRTPEIELLSRCYAILTHLEASQEPVGESAGQLLADIHEKLFPTPTQGFMPEAGR